MVKPQLAALDAVAMAEYARLKSQDWRRAAWKLAMTNREQAKAYLHGAHLLEAWAKELEAMTHVDV